MASTVSRENFDSQAYLKANRDVAKNWGGDAYSHYITHGQYEGRKLKPSIPSPSVEESLASIKTGNNMATTTQAGAPTQQEAERRSEMVEGVVQQTLKDPYVFMKKETPSTIQTSKDIQIREQGMGGTEIGGITDPRFQINGVNTQVPVVTGHAARGVQVSDTPASQYRAFTTGAASMEEAQGQVSSDAVMEAAQGDLDALARAAQGTATEEDFMTAAHADLDAAVATAAVKDVTPQELVSYQMEQLTKGIEEGELPTWARPAADAVEAQLASRGLSRSSVGQAALTNAIIQAAMPMAQQNAQTYFSRTESNLNREQQANLQNAQSKLSITMANLSAENQARLANSQFMQTMTLSNLSNEQQAAITNAQNLASMDMANLDARQQAASQNAQAFLSMDMANLSNRQQASLTKAQLKQQTLLSNQSSENAARQFNAASRNQTNQFMANLGATVSMNNAARQDAMSQFNVGQVNAMRQFRVNTKMAIEQFNAQNATAIDQSNLQWRRQVNQANTAAQNAVNQANAMNAFNLSNQSLTFMWQEMRDAAKWSFEAAQNDAQRKTVLATAAMGNEAATDNSTKNSIAALGAAAMNLYSKIS